MSTFLELYGDLLDRELGTVDRAVAFTVVRRKAVVNEGQREFNRLTGCFVKEASIALSNGVAEYDVEATVTDFLRLSKQGVEVKKVDASAIATYFSGDNLPRRDIPWLNRFEPGWRSASAGNPRSYYVRPSGGNEYLGFYPAIAVAAGETWTGTVPYVALPADMVADVDVPYSVAGNPRQALADWHKGLVHFAAAQLEKFVRKNQQGFADQMQLFGGYVADYNGQQHPKGGQRVTYARTYYRGGDTRVRDPRRYP